MLQGKKATHLPNDAKDTFSAFSAFVIERDKDLSEAWAEIESDTIVSICWDDASGDWRKKMSDQFAKQHFQDCDDGLYDL